MSMQSNILRKLVILTILVNFLPLVNAEDKRTIPLDIYLIIDGSAALRSSKNDAVDWIYRQVVDRILTDGDKITVWNAGDRARIIYSDTVSGSGGNSAAKTALKDKLAALDTDARTADFSGALMEILPKVSQTPQDRLACTMLITASAEGLEPALNGSAQNLFRWFRSEKYERWQVLVVAPDIGRKVQQKAQAYMSYIR